MPMHPLEEILNPQSIAVVGASGNPNARGFDFIQPLLKFGYKGKLYPVNPKYSEVLGLKAYPSIKEIPGFVDYVISCVPASAVLDLLADCSQKGVKAVHLYTARFSETGRRDAAELEQEILRQARKDGIRLIGPNCIGVYYPGKGLSFDHTFPRESGPVGVASQSGGAARNLVYLATMRGIRFSKVISYGNALDFNESDFLDYFSEDPETEIIVMYIEGVKDGRRFFQSLRNAASAKPVIIIKGGRGKSGARTIASHTASLASSMTTWETLVAQAGAVSAKSLEETIDTAVAFTFLPPISGRSVGIAGGGGGDSVLGADQCEEAGFDVIPLPEDMRAEIKRNGFPIWDWIGNPADMSITGDANFGVKDMIKMMGEHPAFDLLIVNLKLSHRKAQQQISADEYLSYYGLTRKGLKPMISVVEERSMGIEEFDGWARGVTAAIKANMIALGIPFYPNMARAIGIARELVKYYKGFNIA